VIYVVAELLDGETLPARLAGSALPARKAAEYATKEKTFTSKDQKLAAGCRILYTPGAKMEIPSRFSTERTTQTSSSEKEYEMQLRNARQRVRRHIESIVTAVLLLGIFASVAAARVVSIQITSRNSFASGASFGTTGAYETLRGTVLFEVDPSDPRNKVVFDLDKAKPNSSGKVQFSADFFILKPVDLTKGNGALLAEVPNRGSKNALAFFNDASPSANANNPSVALDAGNGFLFRQGYTLAWVGWSAGIVAGGDRLTAQFPVAIQNGQPITGPVLTVFWDAEFGGATPLTLPLSGYSIFNSFATVSTDQAVAQAELRVRPSDSVRPSGPVIPDGTVVPTSQWSFAKCPTGPPGTPSTTDICLAGGFQNNQVYEIVYQATGSPVSGLGYVTTRDFVSFLRKATVDDAGTPNPLAGVSRTLCHGYSISGQYLRDFVYQGFNEDEQGQKVCDAMMVHSAGGQKASLNYRFVSDPNSTPFRSQHGDRGAPETNFPRTYTMRSDPLSGGADGLLKRSATDPKIIHVNSSTEYWERRGSLLDTDENGLADLVESPNVRRYLITGTQHSTTKGALPTFSVGSRQCQQLSNTFHRGSVLRALLVSLEGWVHTGVVPPASQGPRLSDGTLVASDQATTGFPAIQGVTYNGLLNGSGDRDFGPRVSNNSGIIDNLHAPVLSSHRLLVPKVDAVGNDVAGIRHPFVDVPTATLTGWSLRRSEFTDGDLCDAAGMMIPLRRTVAERTAAGDSRPSLQELYTDQTGYIAKITAAAQKLMGSGFLLQEDVDATIQEASAAPVLPANAITDGAGFTVNDIAPGSIVSIFGTGLAGAVLQASPTSALPTALFDAGVTFNNIPAPLYYVSPTQIDAQVPLELTPGPVTVQVLKNLAVSASQVLNLLAAAPAILSVNQQGTGAGLVFHAADSTLVTTSSPAKAGETLLIYCTGLGALKSTLKSGQLPPSPPPDTVSAPQVTIGGATAVLTVSGAAPGYVGLYQVGAQVPANSQKGNSVAITLALGGVSSNAVTIAIQ
jgi:uncharacterized protein (TIGR03437 family)